MKFDRVKQFAMRCRLLSGRKGCRDCGRVLPRGLFLRGTPGLSDMVRDGRSPRELKAAMRSRGWYCKKCCNRQMRVGTPTATLRDQFPNQEAYYEFLFWRKNGPDRFLQVYKKKYDGPTMGIVHETAAASTSPSAPAQAPAPVQ